MNFSTQIYLYTAIYDTKESFQSKGDLEKHVKETIFHFYLLKKNQI